LKREKSEKELECEVRKGKSAVTGPISYELLGGPIGIEAQAPTSFKKEAKHPRGKEKEIQARRKKTMRPLTTKKGS